MLGSELVCFLLNLASNLKFVGGDSLTCSLGFKIDNLMLYCKILLYYYGDNELVILDDLILYFL